MTLTLFVGASPREMVAVSSEIVSASLLAMFMPMRTTIVQEMVGRRVPVMISSEQEYYWSTAWQEGETEAESDLQAGRSRIFSNVHDAADWLLSDDE